MSVLQEGQIDDVVKLLYDKTLLSTVSKEDAKNFGGALCKGMCKNPEWIAIAMLAARDCKERQPEES